MMSIDWFWPHSISAYSDDIISMLQESVNDEGILGYADPLSDNDARSFIAEVEASLTQESGGILLAKDIGKSTIIAMCKLNFSAMPNCQHIGYVNKAFIKPEYRKLGLVYEMAIAICDYALDHGIENFHIDVRAGSKAHQVWLRLGFEQFGFLPEYVKINNTFYPGCFMWQKVAKIRSIAAHSKENHDRIHI